MASSAIANLFSFFTPSKPPPSSAPPLKTPLQLSTTSSDSSPTLSPPFSLLRNNSPIKETPSLSLSSSSNDNDIMSVVCPSLAYANTLFFRSAYNVQVLVDENEPEEKLLNRFRREVMKSGVIQECRRRRFFENKQDDKKRKFREAARRNRRRRPQARSSFLEKQENSKNRKEDEDEEDNWDLSDLDLPY